MDGVYPISTEDPGATRKAFTAGSVTKSFVSIRMCNFYVSILKSHVLARPVHPHLIQKGTPRGKSVSGGCVGDLGNYGVLQKTQ